MDESVVFVEELRSGDSDLCVIDSEENRLVLNSRKGKVKLNNPNQSIIDLTKNMPQIKNKKKIVNVTVHKNEKSKENTPRNCSEVAEKSKTSCTLECPVCFGYLPDLIVKITSCGHMFCDDCMTDLTTGISPLCPICRKSIVRKNLRRVFLH